MKENNKWRILEQIGEGQHSKVYKIEQLINDVKTECALKYVDYSDYLKNESVLNQIRNELTIIEKVNGDKNIIHYYSYSDSKDQHKIFITMELLDNINSYYAGKRISDNDVLQLGKDIASALKTCHNNGIIHRDIKPGNIYRDSEGVFKLGDFSLSANDNSIKYYGTPSYIAPEYMHEDSDQRIDIYSLGIVMYALLNNGRLPFENRRRSLYKAVEIRNSGTKIPRIIGVDNKLMKIILKATEYDREKRYSSIEEMINDLEKIKKVKERKHIIDLGFLRIDKTLKLTDPIVRSRWLTNLDTIRKKHTTRDIIKKVVLIFLMILLLIGGSILYLFNRKCPDGTINKRGFCVSGYYYCNKGYKLINKKCQKVVESTAARKSYYCPKDYILNDEVCVNKHTKDPEYNYKCADGFILKGTKCETEVSAEAAVIYYCPDGYIQAGTECVTLGSIEAERQFSCPDSTYTLNGNRCIKQIGSRTKALIVYGCPKGGTLDGSTCVKESSPNYNGETPYCLQGTYDETKDVCRYTYKASTSYSCVTGTSDGKGNCVRNSNITVSAVLTYVCPEGYTQVGNMCTNTATIPGTPKYTCTTDTTLIGNMCHGTMTSDAIGLFTCPKGYLLSGTTCLLDDFKKPKTKYTCSRVYTLHGNKCERYKLIDAKTKET